MWFGTKNIMKRQIFIYFILLVITIITLFPVVWMFLSSIKPKVYLFHSPPLWIPPKVTLSNYLEVFIRVPFLRYYVNSIVIAMSTLAIALVIGTMAAYSFSRYRFIGSRFFFFAIIISRMIPWVSIIMPIYLLIAHLGLLNTHIGVILAHSTIQLPFIIWFMKGFFDGLPRFYEEAAMIDGCSRLGALRVILPLILPGIMVSAMFTFLLSWNEFMFVLTLTSDQTAATGPVGLAGLVEPHELRWGQMTAGGSLYIIPAIILGRYLQKHAARIFIGGIKG